MKAQMHLGTLALAITLLTMAPATAQSIAGIAATDSNINIDLSNSGSANVKIYSIGIYEDYDSQSPGTAVYSGTGAGNISVARFSGSVDRLYMAFQLANGSTNAAIGQPQHVTDVSALSTTEDSFEG